MTQYEIKSPNEAIKKEIFFNKNTDKLSYKDTNGITNDVQNNLVSGTDIKTINGSTLLGSGNLVISGGVTGVTGTSPIASSGGATPAISIATADTTTNGALTSTDWNTFNGKQAALVSGTSIKTVNSNSLLGSGDVAVQPTLVSGTNIKTVNGSTLLGSGDLVIGGGGGASGIQTAILGGGSLFGGLETSNMVSSGQIQIYTTQADNVVYLPYIPNQTFTSTQLSLYLSNGIGGSLAKLGIYSHNGINLPLNRLYQSADIDFSNNGNKTVLTNFAFTKGTTYWLAIHTNTFNSQLYGMSSGALPIGMLTTSTIVGWIELGATYSSGMPATANIQSLQTIAPTIRIK